MCVKKTLLSSNYQMGFSKHIGDILYVAKFVKNVINKSINRTSFQCGIWNQSILVKIF